VHTFKRAHARGAGFRDAESALAQPADWLDDYNR